MSNSNVNIVALVTMQFICICVKLWLLEQSLDKQHFEVNQRLSNIENNFNCSYGKGP